MTGFDYVIAVIVVLSSLLSLIRGFVREAISLVVWIVAGVVALTFAPKVAVLLTDYVAIEGLRTAAAFVVLFIAVLVLGSIVSFLLGQLLRGGGLSGTDRIFGLLFGLARGIVIVSVLVLLGSMTPFAKEPWWVQSQLIPYVLPIANWLKGFLPSELVVPAAVS